MIQANKGKATARDQAIARLLKWAPWLAFLLLALPIPTVFFVLFLSAAATDSAAIYLLLSFTSLGLGIGLGLLVGVVLLLYYRSWLRRFRDKLASDGITAREVPWFTSELTSAERKALRDIKVQNLLLADAYLETLAARLTASRVISRVKRELLQVERRINRARTLAGADTASLLSDLESDRQRFDQVKREANLRLAQTNTRLQTIEAAASRTLSQAETEQMLRRLSTAQEQVPLALELAQLEQEALLEASYHEAAPVVSKPQS